MPIAVPENLTIRVFIVRERRERFLELLANPKYRHIIFDFSTPAAYLSPQ